MAKIKNTEALIFLSGKLVLLRFDESQRMAFEMFVDQDGSPVTIATVLANFYLYLFAAAGAARDQKDNGPSKSGQKIIADLMSGKKPINPLPDPEKFKAWLKEASEEDLNKIYNAIHQAEIDRLNILESQISIQ